MRQFYKKFIEQLGDRFAIDQKSFSKSDFGPFQRVEFNSDKMGGVVDIWDSGELSIHLVDYQGGKELINVFFESSQRLEKEYALNNLICLLSN